VKKSFVYILTNKRNGTLYTGVTSDLLRRIFEHKSSFSKESFSARYRCHYLVYYELHDCISTAIQREKQIKSGSRKKKLALIESVNPLWKDLYSEICSF
jgi:putative endonuclease